MNFEGYHFSVADRFIRYVQVDTQSDPHSITFPSTEKQKDLSRILVQELIALGINDAEMDDYGYVYATIPSNTSKKVPVICFCAHIDTSSDAPGNNVKPLIHRNYDGMPIVLPDDPKQVITIENHPYLKEKLGDDIITASGTTLLGADDKAGVAVIMDMVQYLVMHPEVKHGDIRILFTPDEEIGKGVDHLNMNRLNAAFGYTLDGSELGSLEDETFSADSVTIKFHGISAHPGYSKEKLVNAIKLASHFMDMLPLAGWSPETTEGREGFVHPVDIMGTVELATVTFIVRDFDEGILKSHTDRLKALAEAALLDFKGAWMEMEIKEQYRNMKSILDRHPMVVALAEEAIRRVGLNPRKFPVRGGTDGSRLSFMGLPCPNIFTGEMAFHSLQEFVSVQDMQKAVMTIVQLSHLWEEKSS